MATINQKQELNECFICIWREERSLWDIKSTSNKDRRAISRAIPNFNFSLEPRFYPSFTFFPFFSFVLLYKQRQQQQVLLQSPCLQFHFLMNSVFVHIFEVFLTPYWLVVTKDNR